MVDEVDDASIPDDHAIWRRVPPDQAVIEDGRVVPSSGAFCDSSDGSGMSCSLGLPGRDPNDLLTGEAPGSGVVSITAGHLRSLGLKLVRRPEIGDPHHVEILGKKPRGARRRIKEVARWVVIAKANVT